MPIQRAAKCSIELLIAALAHARGELGSGCLPAPVPVGRVRGKRG